MCRTMNREPTFEPANASPERANKGDYGALSCLPVSLVDDLIEAGRKAAGSCIEAASTAAQPRELSQVRRQQVSAALNDIVL